MLGFGSSQRTKSITVLIACQWAPISGNRGRAARFLYASHSKISPAAPSWATPCTT